MEKLKALFAKVVAFLKSLFVKAEVAEEADVSATAAVVADAVAEVPAEEVPVAEEVAAQ